MGSNELFKCLLGDSSPGNGLLIGNLPPIDAGAAIASLPRALKPACKQKFFNPSPWGYDRG